MTLSINTYYLWKWADNDLSGKPSEVFSRLLHGQMHPAIQSFDARPILRGLNGIAAKRRALGEEWDWQIQPDAAPNRAHFLFLRCPAIACCGGFGEYFIDLVEHQWGLSGYAEQKGSLIQGLPPKLNSFSLGDFFEEPQFDISESDLPALLGQIHPEARCPFAILSNRANHYVQCYVRRNGIQVEWHKCRHIDGAKDCLQWRAGYRNQRYDKCKPKFISEQRTVDGESRIIKFQQFPQEQLRFGDVLHIFQTFFCGAPRPTRYRWRNLKHELDVEV